MPRQKQKSPLKPPERDPLTLLEEAGWISIEAAAGLTGYEPAYLRQLLIRGAVVGSKLGEHYWLVSKRSLLDYAANAHHGWPKGKPRQAKRGNDSAA